MKTEKQLQKQVDDFNIAYPIDSNICLKQDNGQTLNTIVVQEARVLNGHSAVAWFEGISGCYSIDRVIGHE